MQKEDDEPLIKTKTAVSDGERLQIQKEEQRVEKASMGDVEKDSVKFMEKDEQQLLQMGLLCL
jgi:hypothetical protein